MPRTPNLHPNVAAFLDLIAWCEGTSSSKNTYDDGYDICVGGEQFSDYEHHPFEHRPPLHIRRGLNSTAAGRYQILLRYWDAYKRTLNLDDFSPKNQDKIALEMLIECRAMPLLKKGDLHNAVLATCSRWASLPGAGYGQHEHSWDVVRKKYCEFGGCIDE